MPTYLKVNLKSVWSCFFILKLYVSVFPFPFSADEGFFKQKSGGRS